ncbi:8-oxo-dGTP diphosphatase [Streptococcus rupicaprae]|uniref:8-oxo-dGTP diphosphatase n=1 Tax=Streptococcus rupicaprae TaxID=759619 RepID=A0ABV2FHS7_9STRE
MSVKLIAHVLLTYQGKYLLIKRSRIKRGQANVYPNYWDIPGGSVEFGELPRDAAVREVREETGLIISDEGLSLIHEDSQFDTHKQTVFTRLVYRYGLLETPETIVLDPEEHVDDCWLDCHQAQKLQLVPYLKDILEIKART